MAQIVSHCSITYSKQLLKKELKALVIDKLAELEIIVLLAQSESTVLVESGIINKRAGGQKSEGHHLTFEVRG